MEDKDWNGFVAWNKVVTDGVGMNGAKLQGLSQRVNQPKKVGKIEDVLSALEIHEMEVKEFIRVSGNEIADISRFTALRSLVPKELDEELGKLRNLEFSTVKGEYKAYEEGKKYVVNQVQQRREPCFQTPSRGLNSWESGDQCMPCLAKDGQWRGRCRSKSFASSTRTDPGGD